MPPAMGRPIKGEQRRDRSLQIRLSESEMKDLDECASRMNVPRTDVISQGISLVKAELDKEKG
jgi:Fe-S cluster assembly ATPase SufC